MLASFAVISVTALLSSALTLFGAWLWWQCSGRREMEKRVSELQSQLGREVEAGVRRAVGEALAEVSAGGVLRDATWKVARSGSDMLSERLNAIFGKRRRAENAGEEN